MLMAASLSVVAAPTGAVPSLSGEQAESGLADVREAYSEWQAAADRAARYRSILVECVLDARRDHGAKLAEIAEAMGVTRQMVQKIIREAERGEAEADAEADYYAAKARADERAHMKGLGFTPADRQCGVCHRFKSAPSAVCDYCGDDPVTYNGSARDYDAAYAGGIR